MVFYRKYRPQTINDLDSKAVRDSLTAVLSQLDPPHAFLFTGPKGLGKTSTARIVAKAINCEKRTKSLEPCNTCNQCSSITNGSNVDIIEIDGASNRNIDDVRDLKEKITLSPASARKKVYIVDEVHMFTTESFNALLKTLEEPPAHAMFILCTTERQKVPATIVSRCFTIDFHTATKEELVRSFKRIALGEGFTIADDALEAIVGLADGGFRDGAKILEELVGLSADKKITKELVESRYKVVSTQYSVVSLIAALQKKDAKVGLEIVQKIVDEGMDVKQFLFQLLQTVHDTMIRIIVAGEKAEVEELRSLLILLNKAFVDMKYAVLPQLPLELAIIEWSSHTPHPSLLTPVKQADSFASLSPSPKGEGIAAVTSSPSRERIEVRGTQPSATVTVSSMRKQVGDLARVKALYGEPKIVKVDVKDGAQGISLMQVSNSEITPEWLQHFWNSFIGETKQHNHTLAGVLRGCSLKTFNNKSLVIEAAYKFHKDRLDEAKTRAVLEQVCKTLTGNTVIVEVVLKGG